MSEETLQFAKNLFDSYQEGSAAALVEAFSPDVTWLGAEPGTACNGRAEVIGFLMRQRTHGLPLLLEETVDQANKVLAVIRVPGIAALQDRERDERGYHVLTIEEGIIVRMQDFANRESALEELQS